MKVHKNLKAIRKKHGVTQKELAAVLDFDTSNYSRLENGKMRIYIDQIAKIATYLNEDITYFITYPKRFIDPETLPLPERVTVLFEVNEGEEDNLIQAMQGKCKFIKKKRK